MPFATSYRESVDIRLAFALLLRDRYARSEQLVGDVIVKSEQTQAVQRSHGFGSFIFMKLTPGAHNLTVTSDIWTPYYRSVIIPVVVPAAPVAWPAYPDIALANPALALDDPAQPAAYRAQYDWASLLPTSQYPFDGGATLARGTVRHAGVPVADATVSRLGGSEIPYVTGADGQFVIFFEQAPVTPLSVTLRATHSGLPDTDQAVSIIRGATAVTTIDM